MHLQVPGDPYYSKCGPRTTSSSLCRHVKKADQGPSQSHSIRTPGFTAAFFFQVIQVHTDKPSDKPCSLSSGSSPLFSLPGRHPREGLQSPLFYLCYFSCSSRLSPVFLTFPTTTTPHFLSPTPSRLRSPLYPLLSLPLLGSITQSALPKPSISTGSAKRGKQGET